MGDKEKLENEGKKPMRMGRKVKGSKEGERGKREKEEKGKMRREDRRGEEWRAEEEHRE